MTSNHRYYQQPFAESIILTCLALVLLAFTTSSVLFFAYYFSDTSLGTEPPALMLSVSVCLGLLISYSVIMRLSTVFFMSVFMPQLKLSTFWFFSSITIGVLFAVFILWLGQFFDPPSDVDSTLKQIAAGGTAADILLFLSVVLLAPVGEEYLFRGVLLSGLSSQASTFSAILLSSVVFMAFHLLEYYGHWFALLAIFALGVLLAVLRLRSQSMSTPIICHASYNFIMLTLV